MLNRVRHIGVGKELHSFTHETRLLVLERAQIAGADVQARWLVTLQLHESSRLQEADGGLVRTALNVRGADRGCSSLFRERQNALIELAADAPAPVLGRHREAHLDARRPTVWSGAAVYGLQVPDHGFTGDQVEGDVPVPVVDDLR